MKILFVIKNMNDAKGGAEKVLSQISTGLVERGYDVSLISYEKKSKQSYYPLSDKIKRIYLGIGNSMKAANIVETYRRIIAMRRILKQEQPDVVIGFMHSAFVPLSFAAFGTGVPVIASEHTVSMHYKNKPLQYILLFISSLFVKSITVVSQAVKLSYPAVMRTKMAVIFNPVDQARSDTNNQKSMRKVILNVGHLDQNKDQTTLIKAFAKMADQYSEWDVKIFGEGPLQDSLQSLIQSLDLQQRVYLMGTTKEIGQQYAQADIFAMPSKYESFGLATAEAMSYGVPAVGFRECVGTNEIITHERDGVLVSQETMSRQEAFAKGLEKLMSDKSLRQRLGQEARQSVRQYQCETVTDLWEKLLKTMI